MSRDFNEEEVGILNQVAQEVEEFHVENRKGVSQTKYVFEVVEGSTYWDEEGEDIVVPTEYVGFWMMSYPCDLIYKSLSECINLYPWVKCEHKQRTVYCWEEL